MNYTKIPQENKSEILEKAAINASVEELAQTYKELGFIEFSARALGLACRFRGAEFVKRFIELGATFDFPRTEESERRYCVHAGLKWSNYQSNFSLYLLNIRKHIKGALCCKGLRLSLKVSRKDRKLLSMLPDSERAEVLRVLCDNAERISFSPSELLYYAIFARDEFIVSELKRLGFGLSELRAVPIANGGKVTDYWYEWLTMTKNLSDEDFLPVMKAISEELHGAKLHCTGKLYDLTKKRFANEEIFEFFLENFKTERLNKTQIIRELIDSNAAASLAKLEKTGWLKDIKRREEIISYAQSKPDGVECVAWLLDYKNRTADLAAERRKAEKKMERELNASPTSVTFLRKLWSFAKREDGGLRISNYKGNSTEVQIPETIGRSAVVEIGGGAFAGAGGLCGGRVKTNATYNQLKVHQAITKLTLPESVNFIGVGAFADMLALTEINIPSGVVEIGEAAFYNCIELCSLTIPTTVQSIGKFAFNYCHKLTVTVEKGSYAEEYCRENGVSYKYKETL